MHSGVDSLSPASSAAAVKLVNERSMPGNTSESRIAEFIVLKKNFSTAHWQR